MGRAYRWLRSLFGGKKSQNPNPKDSREKSKGWGIFAKSIREKDHHHPHHKFNENNNNGNYLYVDDDEEQNKRAIAVAAATAAAAEAAVAAAQAAAAVVRLTSGGGKRAEDLAAVKIQAAFRAYLARRALRALKGLVKLQALVRGNIVRKQAAETLRCMQALVRVQARTRACRVLRSEIIQRNLNSRIHQGLSTPKKPEQPIRANTCNPDRSSTLKRNSSKQTSTNADGFDQVHLQPSELRWFQQWMEERYGDTTKSGAIMTSAPLDDEKNAKILEIDTGKQHNYNSKRNTKSNYLHSSYSDQHSHSFTTVPESPSKDSTIAHSPSSVGFPLDYEYEESPQLFSASSSQPVGSRIGPFTPSKSECSRSLFSGYSDFPNYMSYTESSKAKVRSQSAPKQRPEFEKSGSVRRGLGHGLGQQSSLGQRSSLHPFANKCYPGSGRLDRLGMPVKI